MKKFYAVFTDGDFRECDKAVFDADDLKDALRQASLHHTNGVNCYIHDAPPSVVKSRVDEFHDARRKTEVTSEKDG